jgi:hypothetical protein
MKRYLVGLAGLLIALPATAQNRSGYQMPEQYKDVQVRQLEAQRRLLIAMVDSMPERLYRDKATPAQRDFAQQVYHAAGATYSLAGRFILEASPPTQPDTASILNSRQAMRDFLNHVYDWTSEQLRAQSAEARHSNVSFFGNNMPRWQAWDELHQHTIWTAGQIVANFRKHGMAPPGFSFF